MGPMAEKYYDKSSYNYALNNPAIFVDPAGRTVDVTDLVKGGTENDTWLLVQLMANLSKATGSKISTPKDKNVITTHIEGACNAGCDIDSSVNSYISNLLNDKSGVLKVMNNDRNNLPNIEGVPRKNFGSQV